MRYISFILSMILSQAVLQAAPSAERVDTIGLSSIYTTHIIFPTDIVYADLSNKRDIDAMMVENAKDVIALKAKHPFSSTCNVTTMESNGTLRTYILKYDARPKTLVIDEKHSVYDAAPETISISSLYTSHMVYDSDLVYAHLSDNDAVTAMILKQSPNVLAIKARSAFGAKTSSVTVLESTGLIHTYIVSYEDHPSALVMNYQTAERTAEAGDVSDVVQGQGGQLQVVSRLRKDDAPLLKEVIQYPQHLYHIATRKNRITIVCENVFSYSDITYITLRIENRSGVSFEADRTSFVIGSKPNRKNTIVEETNLIPKSSIGTLTVAPGSKEKMTYSFDKVTLAQDQVLRICVYELNGRRDFFLKLSAKDINEARRPDSIAQ